MCSTQMSILGLMLTITIHGLHLLHDTRYPSTTHLGLLLNLCPGGVLLFLQALQFAGILLQCLIMSVGAKFILIYYIHVRTYIGMSICWTVIALHVVVYIVPQVSWRSPLCTSCAHPIRKEESSGLYYMTCLLNYLQRTRMH